MLAGSVGRAFEYPALLRASAVVSGGGNSKWYGRSGTTTNSNPILLIGSQAHLRGMLTRGNLVGVAGFAPAQPEGSGFTDRSDSLTSAHTRKMVAGGGIEPPWNGV